MSLLVGMAPAQGATIILTVPNAIVVTTYHSWCGGTRTESRQINGRFQKGTPTVYLYRDRTTLWCILPHGHRHGNGDDDGHQDPKHSKEDPKHGNLDPKHSKEGSGKKGRP